MSCHYKQAAHSHFVHLQFYMVAIDLLISTTHPIIHLLYSCYICMLQLEGLGRSSAALQNFATEFHQSSQAIEALGEQKAGAFPPSVPCCQDVHRAAAECDLIAPASIRLDSRLLLHLRFPICGVRQPLHMELCRLQVYDMLGNMRSPRTPDLVGSVAICTFL